MPGYPSQSIPVTNNIGTTGAGDLFPTHLDWLGKGGHRAVATIAERNAITEARRSFGMLVSVNADTNPANNKTYQLCNVAMGGTNNSLDPSNNSNLNWREFGGANFDFADGPKSLYSDPVTGQIVDTQYTTTRLLDSFEGADFDEKLRYACQNADNGTVIDCTAYQGAEEVLTQTVVITKAVKLLFPSMLISYESDGGVRDHMFWIKSNGVTIEGTGRSSKKDQVVFGANTQFVMTLPSGTTVNGGYHICNENDFPNYDSDILFTANNQFSVVGKNLINDFIVNDNDYNKIEILNATNPTNNGVYTITSVNYGGGNTNFTVSVNTIVASPTVDTSTNIVFQADKNGPNVITLKGFDCIGNERNYNSSNATVPWPSGSFNFGLNPYGVGGICIVEGNPFVTGGGNAVNQVYVENIFIWKTRDHGLLILGAILAQVINCRVSNAAGHGFYLGGTAVSPGTLFTLGGSTSTYFVNCYASSGKLAGFCSHASSYSQFQNCAAEFFGMGYFLRSSFNISLFGCGAEQNDISESIPSNLGITFKTIGATGGLVEKTLNDVGTDFTGRFKGSSLYIGGGRNLYIPNFFSTEPGNRAGETSAGSQHTTHITIFQEARAVYITNPRLTGDSPVINPIRIEASGLLIPRDVNLFFNPVDDRPSGSFFDTAPNVTLVKTSTPLTACTGIILDEGVNTEIKNGATFYRPFIYTPDEVYGTDTNNIIGYLGIDAETNQLLPVTTVATSETIHIAVGSYMSPSSTIYTSPIGISTSSPDPNLLALIPPGQNKKILSFSIMGTSTIGSEDSINVYLYTATADILLYTFTSSNSFPSNVILPSPISIDGPWAIKIVPTGYGGFIKSLALAVINY